MEKYDKLVLSSPFFAEKRVSCHLKLNRNNPPRKSRHTRWSLFTCTCSESVLSNVDVLCIVSPQQGHLHDRNDIVTSMKLPQRQIIATNTSNPSFFCSHRNDPLHKHCHTNNTLPPNAHYDFSITMYILRLCTSSFSLSSTSTSASTPATSRGSCQWFWSNSLLLWRVINK